MDGTEKLRKAPLQERIGRVRGLAVFIYDERRVG